MCADTNTNDTHPYRLNGNPPLPFDQDRNTCRGIPVYAVLDLGRPNEDPSVDRVFLDEQAATHHATRIRSEDGIPVIVFPTKLE